MSVSSLLLIDTALVRTPLTEQFESDVDRTPGRICSCRCASARNYFVAHCAPVVAKCRTRWVGTGGARRAGAPPTSYVWRPRSVSHCWSVADKSEGSSTTLSWDVCNSSSPPPPTCRTVSLSRNRPFPDFQLKVWVAHIRCACRLDTAVPRAACPLL